MIRMTDERCPIEEKSDDLDRLLRHSFVLCDYCRTQAVLERTKGEEVLFPNGPPYWVREKINAKKAAKEASEKAERKKADVQKSNRGKKAPVEKDEVIRYDQQLVCDLRRQGLSKEEAVRKLVEQKRKESEKNKTTKEKEHVDPDQMPWNVPAPFPHKKSVLSRADHQRYVAIVTNFLKPEVQLRYKHNRLEINSMDQQLAEERQEFQRLTLKNVLNKRKLAFSNCSKKAAEFVLTRLRKRCDFDGCFMKSPDLEFKEWTGGVGSEYANIDQAPILKNTLHPGLMPKISIPNERRKYVFDLNAENVESRFPPSESNKYPIELDELAVHFAMKNSISVMMDLSATLAILCNPWINDNCSYALPVNVRHQFNSVYNRVDKICIVGKPCPCDSLNPITLWRRFVKYALKSSIQLKRKIGSGKGGRQRTKTSKLRSVESGTSKTRGDETMEGDKESQNEGDHSPLDNLAIATDDENEIGSPKQTSTNAQFIRNSASNSTDDLLGSIMSGMGAADHAESLETSRLSADDLSHYNGANLAKRYSIFTFGHDGTQDVDVLIRSNNDGVDAGCNICVSHKVEYAPHLGAERLSEEEWLRDCFRCLFKGASELLRLRIHYCDGDLLQKERYRLTSLMKDESRRKVISDRTKRMRSAILNLESLEVGSYVLTFDDSRKMHILSTKENRDSMVNIDAENLKNIKENPTLPSCKTFFQGIDEHLVLVYHIIQKRIPAAFMPAYDTNKGKNGRKSGNHPQPANGRRKRKWTQEPSDT